ncbi:MAG TPA: FadR/GntR family transcriptional regulator [Steroidobacter sp.]|uniref:FadR/GntR family transcriptional regulator n=1 Tax=Steroidobacter sp. TaxID=1978227 RepID=UPI002ED8346A
MKTQVQKVIRHLERAVVSGKFTPDRRLPSERSLATKLAVSRSTVRDAMTTLVSRGMLTRRRGDGTYVVDQSEQHMAQIWTDMSQQHPALQADLVEFRAMVESRAAELAAKRHDPQDRKRLTEALAAVDAAYSGNQRKEQIRSDVEFHRAIADATHNPLFSYLMASLLKLLHEHVQLSLAGLEPESATAQQLRQQHRALATAILARDVDRARAIASGHMEFVATQLNALASTSK